MLLIWVLENASNMSTRQYYCLTEKVELANKIQIIARQSTDYCLMKDFA
jgi:hypothetical protein